LLVLLVGQTTNVLDNINGGYYRVAN
jgi:hypothetical protein